MNDSIQSLDFTRLRELYRTRQATPEDVVKDVLARAERESDKAIWITRLPDTAVLAAARALAGRDPDTLPLFGLPFAIKDNIDFSGYPTTVACPDYAYTPDASAPVVDALIAAGAILIGKTNMDQFATGLVGTRTPYGACANPFDPAYISGGSSAGSAVAVSKGLVSFALGSDTAGSGRVPAAFNNIVGLKPTRGLLSTRGVVPACRSLDCVSIFALNTADAADVFAVVAVFDNDDPFSRRHPVPSGRGAISLPGARIGVPAGDLNFFGNGEAERLFAAAVERAAGLGASVVEIDFAPFLETARLLYEGPWVAERYAAVGDFVDAHPDSLHPVIRTIIGGAAVPSAADAFTAAYRLRELQRQIEPVWSAIDALLTPTAGTIYTIAEVEADPITLNSNLGTYTNYMNLLDFCGVAVPAGFQADGLPFGVTLAAPAFRESTLLPLADTLHRAADTGMGAARHANPAPADTGFSADAASGDTLVLAVCGAHMSGLPLNGELTGRGATLIRSCRSAGKYRFYALEDFSPPRPGMVHTGDAGGHAIDLELWAVPTARFGEFIAGVPSPLAIGTVELEDGTRVKGFVCEAYAAEGARDISELGSWRAYLAEN
ncbi:MAG: allophanate hydrolase [Alphaproteobacteria bacterium]|nr:allophanate hydrolase [Alphaproteobacteria bacterium]